MQSVITDISQLDFSKQYSYADYLTWKFRERVELVKGWILKMSAPSNRHQKISYELTLQLGAYFKRRDCEVRVAPFDVRLPNKNSLSDQTIYTVVQPDLCVICDKAKLDIRGCIGAPDLIMEILSPGNSKKETDEKFRLYEESGVREYWIVYPEDMSVTIFDLIEGKYHFRKIYSNEELATAGIFEGLEIDLREIFAD